MRRYLIGFVATFGLIILLIILIFHGGGKPKPTPKTLSSYAVTDARVRLTIAGPITADQTYQQVEITVSNNSTVFEQIQGYQDNVVNQKTYANNVDSYTSFLLALAHAGFTRGVNDPALKDDRGYCSTGNRFIYEIQQDGQEIQRYWSTNCGKPQTFNGNSALVIQLFQAQVPDFGTLTQDLNISS